MMLWGLVGIWLLPGLGAQAGEIERIRSKGEIVVSLNRGTPPFCMEIDGQLMGLDVDLARLMADYLGVAPRFILPDAYEEQIPRLMAGEADIIIAAMTRTPGRGLLVNFSEPYFEVSQAALVRRDLIQAGTQSYFDLVGIEGIKIGVKQQTTMESFARELFPPEAIRPYASHAEAIEALLRGEVRATVHDAPFVRVWERAHPEMQGKIKALLAPTTREYYGMAVRKADPDFLQWLNLFVAQVKADGTLELLHHRYLVEMPWLAGHSAAPLGMNKAQLLRSEYLARKRAMEQRRQREAMQNAGAPF